MPHSSARKLHLAIFRRHGSAGWRSEVDQTIVVAGQPARNRPVGTVIVVMLLVTFPLLTLLVLEQGRVIDSQRLLIQQLNGDSQQLNAIRARELQERTKHAAPGAKNPPSDTQQQPGAQPQSGAAPQSKDRKRHESTQAPPAPPQEYPATRRVPVRKSV